MSRDDLDVKSVVQRNAVAEHYEQCLHKLAQEHDFLGVLERNFPGQTINVLSIGCGDKPIELDAIQNVFKGKINFVGLDIEEEAIRNCEKVKHPNAEFFVANAADKVTLQKVLQGKKFHVVIFRHPVIDANNNDFLNATVYQFEKMFCAIIPSLLLEGGTLLTSFFLPEEINNFKSILPVITDQELKEFPEYTSPSTLYATIGRPTALTTLEIPLYYDRYFTAVINIKFKVILQENFYIDIKATKLYSNFSTLLFEMIQIANASSNSGYIFQCMLHALIIELSKVSPDASVVTIDQTNHHLIAAKQFILSSVKSDNDNLKNDFKLPDIAWKFLRYAKNNNLLHEKVDLFVRFIIQAICSSPKITNDNDAKSIYVNAFHLGSRLPLFTEMGMRNDDPSNLTLQVLFERCCESENFAMMVLQSTHLLNKLGRYNSAVMQFENPQGQADLYMNSGHYLNRICICHKAVYEFLNDNEKLRDLLSEEQHKQLQQQHYNRSETPSSMFF